MYRTRFGPSVAHPKPVRPQPPTPTPVRPQPPTPTPVQTADAPRESVMEPVTTLPIVYGRDAAALEVHFKGFWWSLAAHSDTAGAFFRVRHASASLVSWNPVLRIGSHVYVSTNCLIRVQKDAATFQARNTGCVTNFVNHGKGRIAPLPADDALVYVIFYYAVVPEHEAEARTIAVHPDHFVGMVHAETCRVALRPPHPPAPKARPQRNGKVLRKTRMLPPAPRRDCDVCTSAPRFPPETFSMAVQASVSVVDAATAAVTTHTADAATATTPAATTTDAGTATTPAATTTNAGTATMPAATTDAATATTLAATTVDASTATATAGGVDASTATMPPAVATSTEAAVSPPFAFEAGDNGLAIYDHTPTEQVVLCYLINTGSEPWPADTRVVAVGGAVIRRNGGLDGRPGVEPGKGFMFCWHIRARDPADVGELSFALHSEEAGGRLDGTPVSVLTDFPGLRSFKPLTRAERAELAEWVASTTAAAGGCESVAQLWARIVGNEPAVSDAIKAKLRLSVLEGVIEELRTAAPQAKRGRKRDPSVPPLAKRKRMADPVQSVE